MNLINRSVPGPFEVHLIIDNVSTHKTPEIHRWLARYQRFHLYFTPTYSSWMTSSSGGSRSSPTSGCAAAPSARRQTELEASINQWIDRWNQDPKPFIWHKSADEILQILAAYCERISGSGH